MYLQSTLGSHVKETQNLIHEAIIALGGYWQPLSGLARLQEEVGELCELTLLAEGQPLTNHNILANSELYRALTVELTDVYIISTCLANQYCISLAEAYREYSKVNLGNRAWRSEEAFVYPIVGRIVQQAGQIARILNHYDGDKVKKKIENQQSLAEEIAKLHHELFLFANMLQLSILDKVKAVVQNNITRDTGRFSLTSDPTTEESALSFLTYSESKSLPYRKIWGAKAWDSTLSLKQNLEQSRVTLQRYVKGGHIEGVEGVVIQIPQDPLPINMDITLKIREYLEQLLQDKLANLELKLILFNACEASRQSMLKGNMGNHYILVSIQEKEE